jgi:SNF2 family DNA or RNA helicase
VELTPYPYQEAGIDFLSRGRAILGDDVGLGKTVQALLAAQKLDAFPTLVVAPKAATGVWIDEVEKWLGMKAATYLGPKRRLRWDDPIVITNYAVFPEILNRRAWRLTIWDEAHKFRNGRIGGRNGTRPQLFKYARSDRAQYAFFLTGSPVVNEADDLWPLLHLIDPKRWKSYWKYVDAYMFKDNNGFGWKIHGVKDAPGLRRDIAPYFLRRTKTSPEVSLQLPPKTRQAWHIEMTPAQRRNYNSLVNEMLLDLPDGGLLAVPSKIALLTRLRQLLVSPHLIMPGGEPGAAFTALRDLFEESPHDAVIFTPFAEATEPLAGFLSKVGQSYIITGKLTPKELTQTVRQFQTDKINRAKILIVTVGMGTSWAATAASTCYFLGYDWAPAINEQAEGRLHRHGQVNPVLARYLVHRGTVDEHVMDILNYKTTIARLAADPEHMLRPKHRGVTAM